ncbi:MAG: hypothetical protein FJ368_02875 [Pelagibacterales bacterium]|nr:hypothetical protein [Pelagibacterales bacterium]
MKKLIPKMLLFLVTFWNLASCEFTKSVWEDVYKEKVSQFLISSDSKVIVFFGEKYHYAFPDNSAKLQQLFDLERNKVILINTEKTKLRVQNSHSISGYICFQTYDYNLSPEQLETLNFLGFRKNEEEFVFELILEVSGERYLSFENPNLYFLISQNIYEFEIKRDQTKTREAEKIAETPFAIFGDSLVVIKEVLASFFKE